MRFEGFGCVPRCLGSVSHVCLMRRPHARRNLGRYRWSRCRPYRCTAERGRNGQEAGAAFRLPNATSATWYRTCPERLIFQLDQASECGCEGAGRAEAATRAAMGTSSKGTWVGWTELLHWTFAVDVLRCVAKGPIFFGGSAFLGLRVRGPERFFRAPSSRSRAPSGATVDLRF